MSALDQPARPRRRRVGRLLLGPFLVLVVVAGSAVGFVAYVLWPRWPATNLAPDAPTLPVIIGGVTFNVPPAAIRMAVQRRPGVQARLDLAFVWPSLAPPPTAGHPPAGPAPAKEPELTTSSRPGDRLFVTIAAIDGTLSIQDRFKTIYPRYTEATPTHGADGLTQVPFRADTPYQGEALFYDGAAPDRFLARCTSEREGPMHGTCLYERRIGSADITVRFPRGYLTEWRTLAASLDRLIAGLRPSGG